MNFRKMKLLELAEFWSQDGEKESPELNDDKTMRLWEDAVNAISYASSDLEILQALHEFKDSDWLEEEDNLKQRFLESFAKDLLDEVKQLKTTVQVLLKQHEGEPANISVGELNDLKGGI